MIPPRAIRGQVLTVDMWNTLVEAIRQNRPLQGTGILLQESPDGTFISAAAQTQTAPAVASTPFSHRWKVTVTTVTDDDTATHTLHITPGSLWRNDGAGVVDLNVAPDEATVTLDDNGNWIVENATAGSLYVADNSANQGTASSGPAYPLKFGDPTKETLPILLRIADLSLTTGTPQEALLTQRQIGDALTGGNSTSSLQPGPLTYEASGSTRRFVRYMGTWVFSEASGVWTFARAVKADGTQYPAAESMAAREMLIRAGGEVYVAYRPDIGPTPTRWLSRKTTTIVGGISYSEPETDADTGALNANDLTLTYFSDMDEVAGDDITLLYTQVEEANEASHFEA